MENSFFVYLSAFEGLMIVCMLGWEIFWLRRMYQVLQNMPTSSQIGDMVNMIKQDREAVKNSLSGLVDTFKPVVNVFSNGFGGLLKSPTKVE